jgi:agmatine deiminase
LLLLAMAMAPSAQADVFRGELVDPDYAATLRDEPPYPPRGRTPFEESLEPFRTIVVPSAPPVGAVRAQAEYETNDGLLIRWNAGQSLLQSRIAVAVTTLTPDARLYVAVRDAAEQSTATSTFSGAGANMTRIEFVTQPCANLSQCTIWMRDYGPRFVDNAGVRAGVDHTYNRPRPVDDAFPGVWSVRSGDPNYVMPITHGGGNFHLFSTRQAFMTQLIETENGGMTSAQIVQMYQDYQGLDVEIVPPFPVTFDVTQHIDMWMYPVDDDEIIVSEYSASVGGGVPKTVSDNFAAARAAEGYTVYRTPGWRSGSTHFTYANAVALNNIVLVCTFTNQPTGTENEAALATFASAFQDKTIVPIDCSSIINSAGAIHCIVMHVPRMDPGEIFRNGFE